MKTYSDIAPYLFWFAQISTVISLILLILASVKGYRSATRKGFKVFQIIVAFIIWIIATAFIQFINAFYIFTNSFSVPNDEIAHFEFNTSFGGLILYQILWILLNVTLIFFVARKSKFKFV